MFNILVVDDNDNIRNLIAERLHGEGYQPFQAVDGEKALDIMDHEHIDLMIADIMMPIMDGYELTAELRGSNYNLPILMVTAKEHIEDKRKGFLAGTDDYMVKPIDFDEMMLRVEALLRRAKINSEKKLTVGDVVLDYDTLIVKVGTEEMLLPQKEFQLLFKLLSYSQKIFTRRDLMDEIWGMDSETDDRTVDVHIKRLRDKFDHLPQFKIVTIRNLGYKAERNI
ncbi:response regulator transcription factor [Anaerosporobacter sp.]|uniref:response regulator transcription factor n=1 Tax=Anaerosporobacter sp. TaxID=1872529 RepID=UPI00286F67E9|nr:response regulator transcription factor [Anaerosporobacter sp.]